jgi:hypothetical protein
MYHGVELAGLEGVEHDLHRADHLVEVRRVAEVRDVGHDLGAEALHEAEALRTDGGDADVGDALAFPFLQAVERDAQHVGVEAAAQTLVGGDDDQADALHFARLLEEGVLVLGVGVGQVGGQPADLLAVGTRGLHALLCLAHLRGRDHLHGLGDLARVLHALDLGAYFLAAWHGWLRLVVTPRSS